MDIPTGIRIALRSLGRHKMRSGLSMLGISIGAGAFICSVAVGEGASVQIAERIHDLGENMIWIEAGGRNVNGVRTGTHGTNSLTVQDMLAIERQVPLVTDVSPNVDMRVQVVYKDRNWSTRVRGVSPEYLTVRHWGLARGNVFSESDIARAAKLCVIGQSIAEILFGQRDPIGQRIFVQKIPCRIIGVLDAKGQSPSGRDQDDVLLMPFTTVQKRIKGISWLDDILCSADSKRDVSVAEDEITALLRERHHVRVGQSDDFNLRHPADVAKAGAKAQHTMTLLLASVASVALLVGGIGIMNIMLASVTERTREIGICVAIGAREHDILFQFLVEAVTLALIGGGIGIGLGVIGSWGIARFAGWRTLLPPETIGAAFGFVGAVGTFSGLYPASKAARLDPIEALTR